MKKCARWWYACDFSCTRHICKVCFIFTKPLPRIGQKDETVVKRKLTYVYSLKLETRKRFHKKYQEMIQLACGVRVQDLL